MALLGGPTPASPSRLWPVGTRAVMIERDAPRLTEPARPARSRRVALVRCAVSWDGRNRLDEDQQAPFAAAW